MQRARFLNVTGVALKLIRAGLDVFSPITYGAALLQVGRLPGAWEFWERFDRYMIGTCTTFAVLQIPGWEESIGVRAERLYAASIDRKEILVHPTRLGEAIEALRNAEKQRGITC